MAPGISASNAAIEEIAQNGFALLDASDNLQDFMEETLVAGDRFFELDLDVKLDSRLPLDGGYRPYGTEYSESSDHPDEVESYTVSHRPTETRHQPSDSAVELHSKMLTLFDVFEEASVEIAKGLHCKFQPQSTITSGALRTWSLLKYNFARPVGVDSEFINDLHEDGCLLTIMSVAGNGFELKVGDRFLEIPASRQQVLAMAGEILWLLTGGRINPIYHRVRTLHARERRRSLLFFADLKPALCEPWLISDINRNIDIGQRVRQNSKRFGLSERSD